MVTHRELLEAAARAHGGLLYVPDCDGWIHVDAYGKRGAWWSPLTDDGDALRLAVKLRLTVVVHAHEIEVFHPDGECLASEHVFSFPTESYAATRRAITRAAAEIGKNMTSA